MNVDVLLSRFAGTHLGVWAIKHLVSPLQRWVYRGSGGKLFTKIGQGRDVLLLTTRGRRTGKERATPVFYVKVGDSIVLCNVNPGFEHTNPWVSNLRADPNARLQIGQNSEPYRAREATPDEVELYWPRFVKIWPTYQVHYERGGRRSVFILEKV